MPGLSTGRALARFAQRLGLSHPVRGRRLARVVAVLGQPSLEFLNSSQQLLDQRRLLRHHCAQRRVLLAQPLHFAEQLLNGRGYGSLLMHDPKCHG
jgi:hypothetical protein